MTDEQRFKAELREAVKRWVLSGKLRMPGSFKALPAPRPEDKWEKV